MNPQEPLNIVPGQPASQTPLVVEPQSTPPAPITVQPMIVTGPQNIVPGTLGSATIPQHFVPGQVPGQQTTSAEPAKLGMFERRMGRMDYFIGGLYAVALLILPSIVMFGLSLYASRSSLYSTGTSSNHLVTVNIISLLVGLIVIVVLIPVSLSLSIRRLHDLDRPGILALLGFVPYAGALFSLYLLFAPGTIGPNKYGNPITSKNFFVVVGLKRPLS